MKGDGLISELIVFDYVYSRLTVAIEMFLEIPFLDTKLSATKEVV